MLDFDEYREWSPEADAEPAARPAPPRRPALPSFRTWLFLGAIAFVACALGGVSVGIRWHVYRAQASKYAREEMQHTFAAAGYERAAGSPGFDPAGVEKSRSLRKIAGMHLKAARECAQLRDFYERSW